MMADNSATNMIKRKVNELKVVDLKVELERRDLDTKGLKAVLIERLQKALAEEGSDENEIDILDSSRIDDSIITLDESKDLGDEVLDINVPDEELLDSDEVSKEIKVEEDKSKSAGDSVSLEVETDQVDALDLELQQSPAKKVDSPSKKDANKSDVVKKESAKEDSKKGGGDNKSSDKSSKDAKVKGKKILASSNDGRNLWVSNLSKKTRATDLKNLFTKHGKVVAAKIVTAAKSPGSKCFGLVTMGSVDEAKTCIEKLNKTDLDGNNILVEKAPQPKKAAPTKTKPTTSEVNGAKTPRTLTSRNRGQGDRNDAISSRIDSSTRRPRLGIGSRTLNRSRPIYNSGPISRPYGNGYMPRVQSHYRSQPYQQQYRDRHVSDVHQRVLDQENATRRQYFSLKMQQMDEKRKVDLIRNKLEKEKLAKDKLERDRFRLEQERLKIEKQRHYEEIMLERERRALTLHRPAVAASTGSSSRGDRRPVKRTHETHGSDLSGYLEPRKRPLTDTRTSFDYYSSNYSRPSAVSSRDIESRSSRDDRVRAAMSGSRYTERTREQPSYSSRRSPPRARPATTYVASRARSPLRRSSPRRRSPVPVSSRSLGSAGGLVYGHSSGPPSQMSQPNYSLPPPSAYSSIPSGYSTSAASYGRSYAPRRF